MTKLFSQVKVNLFKFVSIVRQMLCRMAFYDVIVQNRKSEQESDGWIIWNIS